MKLNCTLTFNCNILKGLDENFCKIMGFFEIYFSFMMSEYDIDFIKEFSELLMKYREENIGKEKKISDFSLYTKDIRFKRMLAPLCTGGEFWYYDGFNIENDFTIDVEDDAALSLWNYYLENLRFI